MTQAEIELITDRSARRYVARTFVGAGAPSEIWTALDPIADDRTAIRVEFCVQPMPDEALRKLGMGYVSLYTLLWDQDEEMMQTREDALAHRRISSAEQTERLMLGQIGEVRSRLPLMIEFAGRSFRIVELQGELVVHSAECQHLLGPLDHLDPCIEPAGARALRGDDRPPDMVVVVGFRHLRRAQAPSHPRRARGAWCPASAFSSVVLVVAGGAGSPPRPPTPEAGASGRSRTPGVVHQAARGARSQHRQ